MEHVSTLCATSTLGIAASGFALGLPENAPKPSKFRRNTLSLNLRDHPALNAIPAELSPGLPPPSPNPPRTSHAALSSTSNVPAKCTSPVHNWSRSEDLNPPNELPRAVKRRPRCQTYSNQPLQATEGQQLDFHPRRPSSSWLRRLSGISFQTESRFPTSSPISPSFNGSRPTSPSLSRPGSQRRPPNKLVKRPPSQDSNAYPSLASAPVPRPSISRRPATSYQRPGTRGHRATHSLTFEPSLATHRTSEIPDTLDPGSNRSWRHLFGSKPDGLPGRLVRRVSAATRQKDQGIRGIRRILPNTDALPTLLLGTSITNQRSTAKEPYQSGSSIQFRDPFNPIDTAPSRTGTPFSVEGRNRAHAPSSSLDGAEPGSPASSTDATNIDRLGRCLTPVEGSPSSNRISNHSKSEGTITGSPRRPEKRSVVDLNVFRSPGDASQVAFPTTSPSEINGPRRRIISFPLSRDAKADMGSRDAVKRPSTSDGIMPSSSQHLIDHHPDLDSIRSRQRAKRHSVAASDPASTVIGSDDTRIFTSGEEDETDFLTDTAFDSIRTHITTNSSSAPRGTRIETLFDRNLSGGLTSEGSSKLERLIPRGSLDPTQLHDPLLPSTQASPVLTSAEFPQRTADKNHDSERVSLTDWSDEDTRSLQSPVPGEIAGKLLQLSHKRGPRNPDTLSAAEFPGVDDVADILPSQDYPQRTSMDTLGTCPKMNIFDWSEQPRNDSEHPGVDARPRTVHGKDPIGARGSRTSGRKAQSTLHLRSQSVPTPREPAFGNETRQTSGKFGTWGLGSKGVSEDWDDDFDFDDADESAVEEDTKTDENTCRGGMIVPQAIMERQDSLHGQFGLVQELTLLVEELKRLRQQATALDIIHGPSDELWKEAEGIINLATIDDEDNGSLPRSPSSLTFSFDDSEEESPSTNSPSKRTSGQSWQRSILGRADSNPRNSRHTRDSSPKAKSALDIVCKRISQDSSIDDGDIPRPGKLPFDTQSLQELVVRAGVITRALKGVIRNSERVSNTPGEDSPPSDPPFSRIFDRSSHGTLRELETPCVG